MKRSLLGGAWTLAWSIALGCAAWAFGALAYDFPFLNGMFAWAFALLLLAAIIFVRGAWRKLGVTFLGFAVVLAWWLMLKSRNERPWQPDVAQTAWAAVNGDVVTLHNVRDCDYRTETDFTPRWETRPVRLSQITGVDLAINYWGSPWMAHPIASFQFADAPPVCFSIETRKEIGESYSAIGGLYRQYELIYVVADERDVIRVRTNFRQGEEVYLYQMTAPPENARERFMDYIAALNDLHEHPHWYNAVTTNCTTSIRAQSVTTRRSPWDWRILLNGKADELFFERGALRTDGATFANLKARSLINGRAQAVNGMADFSRLIRTGAQGKWLRAIDSREHHCSFPTELCPPLRSIKSPPAFRAPARRWAGCAAIAS